jgi:hypothetical protein
MGNLGLKTIAGWWHTPIVLVTVETEASELLEFQEFETRLGNIERPH